MELKDRKEDKEGWLEQIRKRERGVSEQKGTWQKGWGERQQDK